MTESLRSDESAVLSRRRLFRHLALAAGGAMVLSLPRFLEGWTSPAEAALKHSYASGKLVLELDGQFAGVLVGVEGGNPFADIISEGVGGDMIQRKRVGQVRFEDILVDIDFSQIAKPLSTWISETLQKLPAPKNGAVVYTDFNFKEVKRLEFMSAVITEISTPVCDTLNAKTPAALSLRIAPQSTRFSGSSGKTIPPLGTKSKSVMSSNFRLTIGGVEDASKRISKVEAIVVKRPTSQSLAGQEKFKQQPGVLDCSVVTVFLAEAYAGPFYKWLDDTLLKGKQAGEVSGQLDWLDPTMQNVGASAQLGGLGIVRYAPEQASTGSLPMVRVEMYCETMNLIIP